MGGEESHFDIDDFEVNNENTDDIDADFFGSNDLNPDTGLTQSNFVDNISQTGSVYELENNMGDVLAPHGYFTEPVILESLSRIDNDKIGFSEQISNSQTTKYYPINDHNDDQWVDFQDVFYSEEGEKYYNVDDEEDKFYSVNEEDVNTQQEDNINEIANEEYNDHPYDPGNIQNDENEQDKSYVDKFVDYVGDKMGLKGNEEGKDIGVPDPNFSDKYMNTEQKMNLDQKNDEAKMQAVSDVAKPFTSMAGSVWNQIKDAAGTAKTAAKIAGGAVVVGAGVAAASSVMSSHKRAREREVEIHTDPAKDEERMRKIQKQNDMLEQLVANMKK